MILLMLAAFVVVFDLADSLLHLALHLVMGHKAFAEAAFLEVVQLPFSLLLSSLILHLQAASLEAPMVDLDSSKRRTPA